MSPTIGALAAALAKAQGQIEGAKKDATNPHFRSKYADLASTWDACRVALSANGLSVAQTTETRDGQPVLVTRLLHASGEWVAGETPLLLGKADMQGLGSAITYARRYGLASVAGVSPEDDDGNAAVATGEAKAASPAKAPTVAPKGFTDWRDDLGAVADNGTDALKAAWVGAKAEYRAYLNSAEPTTLDALKARADTADKAKVAA